MIMKMKSFLPRESILRERDRGEEREHHRDNHRDQDDDDAVHTNRTK